MNDAAAPRQGHANKEVELKLELDPEAVDALRKHPLLRAGARRARRDPLRTTYYDTPHFALRDAGLSLRVRRIGERRIQTIKAGAQAAAGLFDRSEWERDIAGEGPDLAGAAGTALEPLLADRSLREAIAPVFDLAVERTTYVLAEAGWRAELTLDLGDVTADGRATPLCEVEVELLEGETAALFALARQLTERAPLRLGVRTKAERGYALVENRPPQVVKGADPGLQPGMTTAAAFQAIGRACLTHLMRNEPVLRSRRDPDAVHQMRVALRRLRAAISLFRPVLVDERRAAVAAELKWFASELGDARDLDVFIAGVLDPLAAGAEPLPGLSDLTRHVAGERDAAYQRAEAAVNSDRFRLMVLETAAWLETGPWLDAPQTAALRERPIEAHAAEILQRRRRKVRKQGARLAALEPEARHKVRIEVKKLRYAAEFFRGLYRGKKAAARRKVFLPALERLQEALGLLNDAAVGASFEARVTAADPALSAPAQAVAARQAALGQKALKPALRAYRDFAEAKAFWR